MAPSTIVAIGRGGVVGRRIHRGVPNVTQDEAGMRRLFTQFSFPGGSPSHVPPETPGSIHEGGELGYCLSHAYGAAFDNPKLVAAAVVGDGEAETGPLAASRLSATTSVTMTPRCRLAPRADAHPRNLRSRPSAACRSGTARDTSTLFASAPASKINQGACWFARVTQTIPEFV